MITIEEWMTIIKYRITEGSDYFNNNYGTCLFCLESWDQLHNGVSSHIVFSTLTQEVFEVTVSDYKKDRSYRFINEKFRNTTPPPSEFAWDDVKFIDLETVDDLVTKMTAIMSYQEYDDRIEIPLEFTDSELLSFMKMAHELDMTFNKFVEHTLMNKLNELTNTTD